MCWGNQNEADTEMGGLVTDDTEIRRILLIMECFSEIKQINNI